MTARAGDQDKALAERMMFLRELFKEFGAQLSGYDPGVTAYLPGRPRGRGYMGEQLAFEDMEWAWLEPLLVELRELRKKAATALDQ